MNSDGARLLCSTPPQPKLELPATMPFERQRAVMVGASKWVNGTVLRYTFFDDEARRGWGPASEAQADVVRESFAAWKALDLGLDFKEVGELAEAEVRIAFDQSPEAGSWSYIGRQILDIAANDRTMNFGWDVVADPATALHEIGHTLGMPHEHQSPFSGIVWNEEAVFAYFGGEPNNWPREKTQHNVLTKLDPAQVEGSSWDPNSIMEYEFGPGLIAEPEVYRQGITPPGTISKLDAEWMLNWYPGEKTATAPLAPFASANLALAARQQANFAISPPATRTYQVATFGAADTVAVLFERVDGELRHLASDDDSGEERNAKLDLKLFEGRDYVLRVRVNWAGGSGDTAVMYW